MDVPVLGESAIINGQKYVARLYGNQVWLQIVNIPNCSDIALEEYVHLEQLEEFVNLTEHGRNILKNRGLLK